MISPFPRALSGGATAAAANMPRAAGAGRERASNMGRREHELEYYPDVMSNEELAAASGYSQGGGAYNNPRGRLRTLGLIEYRDGGVAARSVLFPC